MKKIRNKIFNKKEEALEEIANQRKQHPLFTFDHHIVGSFKKIRRSKRKIRVGYKIVPRFCRNEMKIEQLKQRKGRFVLATDQLESNELSGEEIVAAYRNRNKGIEGCFKFLKRKDLNLNQIFLKSESRIEAMMIVMALILFVNNLPEKTIRDYLCEGDLSFPNQLGIKTAKPTFKWISYTMQRIAKIRTKIGGLVYDEIHGLKKEHKTIVKALGDYALRIYGFT